MNVIVNGSASEVDSARKQLREELLAIAPVFGQKPYFLSDEFSPVDCYRRLSCGVYRSWVSNSAAQGRKS